MSLFALQSVRHAHHHRSVVFRWLAHLGMPGVFGVALLDASFIPLPVPGATDLLLLWLISRGGNPWGLVACSVAGALAGGFLTWNVGNKGGEAALHRYVPHRLLNRIQHWAETHPLWAVFLPAILPPPIPLMPFLLAAGALKISLRRFLPVFAAARTLRYGVVAWLGVAYGRRVLRLWDAVEQKWSTPIGWTFGILVVGGVIYGIVRFRRQRGGDADDSGEYAPVGRGI